MSRSTNPDKIARCVIDEFDKLPIKFKPRRLADGRREWVPLAGIVLGYRIDSNHNPEAFEVPSATCHDELTEECKDCSEEVLICVALATGMKCLPQTKIPPARGAVLHDSHAEVLALRAFNRFLLDECLALALPAQSKEPTSSENHENDQHPPILRPRTSPVEALDHHHPFELNPALKIHMFCSELPCGDASMELTMSEQADPTPWSDSNNNNSPSSVSDEVPLPGRAHFDRLGIVRRKPSRPDAPPTLSKSCSDKLALKQCTGLLSGLVTTLVHPGNCYLQTLVLPERGFVREGAERAFGRGGRMRGFAEVAREDWEERGYGFKGFEVKTTRVEFEAGKNTKGDGAVASNLSAVWTRGNRREVLINGVLQGRKQVDLKGASCLSRRAMWRDLEVLAATDGMSNVWREGLEGVKSYGDLKACRLLVEREEVKTEVRRVGLKGWQRNVGDDAWGYEDES